MSSEEVEIITNKVERKLVIFRDPLNVFGRETELPRWDDSSDQYRYLYFYNISPVASFDHAIQASGV